MTTPASGVGSRLGRALLLGLAVAPPAALGVALWEWVRQNVTAAVLLAAGYELVLLAGGFAGKVFGDLQDRWVKTAADHTDELLRRTSSRFERDYRRQVRETVRFVDQKGLITRGDAPELEQIYVDVSLESRPPRETAGGALVADLPAISHKRRSLGDFLQQGHPAVLALIGAPGTGKTTLLRHTTLRLCSHDRALPVLLYLRDHAAAIVERPDVGLPEIIAARLGRLREQEPAGWFDGRLERGRCVVMLDGLDEVTREEHRRLVVDWVERQIAQYAQNDFVITSRPYGYREYPLDSATVLLVRRFTTQQISMFVHAWYRAADRAPGPSKGGPEDLLAELRHNTHLYDLAANPLLLTMIVNVHRIRGDLPGTRAELYAEICRVVLWRHDVRRPGTSLDGEPKEQILRELAYTMMERGTRDLPRAEVTSLIEASLARLAPDGPPPSATLLTDLENSGLLLEREAGAYSFSHQTFQEYLAAAHIHDHPDLQPGLPAAVNDPWWRETILLYAARADPTAIVRACLLSRTVPALALAFDCMDEGRPIAPRVRAELEGLLDTPQDGDPERDRLLSAVVVTRHLRDVVRVSDQVAVCSRPVTPDLHRRFGLPSLTWPEDVEYFLSVVNDLFPGGPAYRLPTRDLAADPAFAVIADPAARPVWVAEPGGPPDLHAADPLRHPFTATPQEVADRVQEDLKDAKVRDTALLACLLYRVYMCKALNSNVPYQEQFGNLFQLAEFAGNPRRARERELVKTDLDDSGSYHDRVLRFVYDRTDLLKSDIDQVQSLVHGLTRDRRLADVPDVDLAEARRACLIGGMAIFLCRWIATNKQAPVLEIRASASASILQPDRGRPLRLFQLVRTYLLKFGAPPLPPQALLAAVRDGVAELSRLTGLGGDRVNLEGAGTEARMAYDVAASLRAVAEEGLAGPGAFDVEFVRCVRLGALAVAAGIMHKPALKSVARSFWEIAVGITALERRATDPSADALILVRS
ncbi:NACHT domain-containing protein [Nonomuraea sp. CA-143628]|uniref:NACHT domain-containing protein n=1 Tax=Nonomuraea sp. CA-143628 TaxID=3239997 RepID=UPI003D8DE64E